MNKKNGSDSWKEAYYAPFDEQSLSEAYAKGASDLQRLSGMHELLKLGDFSQTKNLSKWLTHPSEDIQRYAARLFADVCGHQDVLEFETIMGQPQNAENAYRVLLWLGDTLAPLAVPLILFYWENYREDVTSAERIEFDAYARTALNTILAREVVDACRFPEGPLSGLHAHAETLDRSLFYLEGKPAFLGDMTKELINFAVISYKEQEPFIGGTQIHHLACATGLWCPVQRQQILTEADVHQVLNYVEKVGDEFSWVDAGAKYFYGHKVP